MRYFGFFTLGRIIKEINNETGGNLTRPTYLRWAKKFNLPTGRENEDKSWRRFTKDEAALIKKTFREEYFRLS